MATIEDLTKMRVALFAARMSGAREFRDQNGESVTYKSDAEMANAMAAIDAEIARLNGVSPRVLSFTTSKGT
jgi:hypothetical protein